MKSNIVYYLFIVFFIFVFVVFFKGLNDSNIYTPKTEIKIIPEFKSKNFINKKELNSKDIFSNENFYLLNIWSSWCIPCKDEHPLLIDLGKNEKIELIGLNYKDNFYNAQKFITEYGNPYSIILLDEKGTIAIEWGAFGVPETFLIYKKEIIKRYIGPLNKESINEIEKYIK